MKIEDHYVKIRAFENVMGKLDWCADARIIAWMMEKAATHWVNIALHAWGITTVTPNGAADLVKMKRPTGAAFVDGARTKILASLGDFIHTKSKPANVMLTPDAVRLFEKLSFFEKEREGLVRGDVAGTAASKQEWTARYEEVRSLSLEAWRSSR